MIINSARHSQRTNKLHQTSGNRSNSSCAKSKQSIHGAKGKVHHKPSDTSTPQPSTNKPVLYAAKKTSTSSSSILSNCTSNSWNKNSGYITCLVCNQTKYYSHVQRRYGIFSCEPCFKFFSRFVKEPKCLKCNDKGKCLIVINTNNASESNAQQSQQHSTGTRCKACWLKLCFDKFKIDINTRQSLIDKYLCNTPNNANHSTADDKHSQRDDAHSSGIGETCNTTKTCNIGAQELNNRPNQTSKVMLIARRKRVSIAQRPTPKKRPRLSFEKRLAAFAKYDLNDGNDGDGGIQQHHTVKHCTNKSTPAHQPLPPCKNLLQLSKMAPAVSNAPLLQHSNHHSSKPPHLQIVQEDEHKFMSEPKSSKHVTPSVKEPEPESWPVDNRSNNNSNKKSRCKECDGCRAQDCGQCSYCLDKKKFGGSNVIKQACKYRVCIRFRTSPRRSLSHTPIHTSSDHSSSSSNLNMTTMETSSNESFGNAMNSCCHSPPHPPSQPSTFQVANSTGHCSPAATSTSTQSLTLPSIVVTGHQQPNSTSQQMCWSSLLTPSPSPHGSSSSSNCCTGVSYCGQSSNSDSQPYLQSNAPMYAPTSSNPVNDQACHSTNPCSSSSSCSSSSFSYDEQQYFNHQNNVQCWPSTSQYEQYYYDAGNQEAECSNHVSHVTPNGHYEQCDHTPFNNTGPMTRWSFNSSPPSMLGWNISFTCQYGSSPSLSSPSNMTHSQPSECEQWPSAGYGYSAWCHQSGNMPNVSGNEPIPTSSDNAVMYYNNHPQQYSPMQSSSSSSSSFHHQHPHQASYEHATGQYGGDK